MTTRQRQIHNKVIRNSKPLEAQLERWLTRMGKLASDEEIKRLTANKARLTDDDLRAELQALLTRFGIRQAATAAGGVGQTIRGTEISDAIAGKPTRIKWFWEYRQGVHQRVSDIMDTTREEVRASVRQILLDASKEERTPSTGEIARRIASQFHGREEGGRIHTFSSERAAVIAQTESVQAENTGIFEGYKATGVEMIEWLAQPGSERHGSLSGKRVKIGQYFTADNGDKLRYPGDPNAPIRSTINCRCVSVAVIERRRR